MALLTQVESEKNGAAPGWGLYKHVELKWGEGSGKDNIKCAEWNY